jgi:tetratricopeptide (TPR) repeat protein
MAAGRTDAQDCLGAARAATPTATGLASCNAALASDLSVAARTGTLLNRATLLAAAGDNQAALADYNMAIARDAGIGGAYLGRGTVLLRQGHYAEAKADLSRALTLGTAAAHIAYFNRAQAEEASGDTLGAYHDYQRARQAAPDFQAASLELARFHVTGRRVAANP